MSTSGVGAPGIAEQAGSLEVAPWHFGPRLRRNRLWLRASDGTRAASAAVPVVLS